MDDDHFFTHDAKQVVNIRMVCEPNDLLVPNKNCFKPDLVHQVFGDNELLFGYRNLGLDICYAAKSGHCYVDFKYTDIYKRGSDYDPQPDDIYAKLSQWLPSNYTTDRSEFLTLLEKENNDAGYGYAVAKYDVKNKNDEMSTFRVNVCSVDDEEFRLFHDRFQTLIIFFIDAANYIDLTDNKWMIFYMYEERKINGNTVSYPIGFCTVYQFFAYPNGVRPRISQFFILPPYQRRGLGTKLLQSVYTHLQAKSNVTEITVEKPNAAFSRMRDILDTKLVLSLRQFHKQKVLHSYSNAMQASAKQMFKLNCKQIARIYKIVLYYYTQNTRAEHIFEKYCKLRCYRTYKAKYDMAKRTRNTDHMERLINIIESDFMTNRSIEYKFKQFVRQLQPIMAALKK